MLNTSLEELSLESVHDIVHSPVRKRKSLDRAIFDKAHCDARDFLPLHPDRLIGVNIGVKAIDIPTRLSLMNISCVSNILSLVDDQDLCK